MKSYIKTVLMVTFIFFISNKVFSQYVFIGPTYHYNIGGGLKESYLV